MSPATTSIADREKRLVALTSVGAALFLTGTKVVVGLLTNSLGILSEAAHSGLDLGAAILTLAAVRVSGRPPDSDHLYGHGKVENLSALLQTLLLLITCAWIVREAAQRLISGNVEVEVTVWSFAVIGASIIVDVSRSRALARVARKHKSQALEADALHFSTDVWSSVVVLVGLVGVLLARWLPAHTSLHADWLKHADAVAALGVSAIVIGVTLSLGRRAIDALLDTAPRGLAPEVEQAVRSVPGVAGVSHVRVRGSGADTFVDMAIAVARNMSLEAAHGVANAAEQTLLERFPGIDVVVHVDPIATGQVSLVEEVHCAAARQGLTMHGLRAHDVGGRIYAAMHVEVPEEMTLAAAHERVTAFEDELRRELPTIEDIVTHIEPRGDREAHRAAQRALATDVHDVVADLPRLVPGVQDCHQVSVHRTGEDLTLSFHCLMDPDLSIADAHALTERVERVLRARIAGLGRVVVHMEPAGHPGV
jgi:cation diffusion facilitator family transporter